MSDFTEMFATCRRQVVKSRGTSRSKGKDPVVSPLYLKCWLIIRECCGMHNLRPKGDVNDMDKKLCGCGWRVILDTLKVRVQDRVCYTFMQTYRRVWRGACR